MNNKIIIYHGSINIVEKPIYGYGKKYNDYGLGFYCTEEIELAKEWSCSLNKDGYVNKYELDFSGLNVLNLSKNYDLLYWITILLNNITFKINNEISRIGRDYLQKNYSINVDDYDVIIGYRADDSYFRFASDFLNNSISIRKLNDAIKLGNLGEQIVLKSKKAFEQLKFLGYESVDSNIYYKLREKRNIDAKHAYENKNNSITKDDIFLNDLIRGDYK